MKSGSKIFYPLISVFLCLAMPSAVHGITLATSLENDISKSNASSHQEKKQVNEIKATNYPLSKTALTPLDNQFFLKKPKVLEPTSITTKDPWVHLDTLVVRQSIAQSPHVPWIQNIGIGIDYGRLAMNLFTPKAINGALDVSILFRKNIQLSIKLGRQKLSQARSMGNKEDYTVVGNYGNAGLDYLFFYNSRNNLYTGLRYGISKFRHNIASTLSTKQSTNNNSIASWCELVIGSERQLFVNLGLYAGFVVHLKGLGNFKKFTSTPNYVVPGYGRNVQNIVPAITLYIKYQVSFLKNQIVFN